MLAGLHHTISRTLAAAALPSVIGGPGTEFKTEGAGGRPAIAA